jgi:hypothetical protein
MNYFKQWKVWPWTITRVYTGKYYTLDRETQRGTSVLVVGDDKDLMLLALLITDVLGEKELQQLGDVIRARLKGLKGAGDETIKPT